MLDKKAYTEVFFIINLMSEEMKNKIPDKILKNIQNRMDTEYKFNIDKENIDDIDLLEDTEKILAVLYTDYFSSDEEREIIINKEKILTSSKNVIKQQDIEIHNIFESKNENNNYEEIKINQELTEIHREKWYEKLLKFIKNIFN